MALFPAISDGDGYTGTEPSSNPDVKWPDNLEAGDLVFVSISYINTAATVSNWPANTTVLLNATGMALAVAVIEAQGTETGGSTFSLTLNSRCLWATERITGNADPDTTVPILLQASTAPPSITADPPSVTTPIGWDNTNTLWVVTTHWYDSMRSFSAPLDATHPASYTHYQLFYPVTSLALELSSRQYDGQTQNPGSFSVSYLHWTSGYCRWRSATVAIPAAPAAAIDLGDASALAAADTAAHLAGPRQLNPDTVVQAALANGQLGGDRNLDGSGLAAARSRGVLQLQGQKVLIGQPTKAAALAEGSLGITDTSEIPQAYELSLQATQIVELVLEPGDVLYGQS